MKTTLTTALASLLGAEIIFANPISPVPGVAHAARRSARNLRKSNPEIHALNDDPHNLTATNNTQTIRYSNNWAGAVLVDTGFQSVTGTFTVPTVKIPSGGNSATLYWASTWVGLGGNTCNTAILQTGIYLNIQGDRVFFRPWYEWFPEPAQVFEDLAVNAGDQLKLTAVAASTSAGIIVIKNLSTGKQVSQTLSRKIDLSCQLNAEWIVEDNRLDGKALPFIDFGTTTFTEASVTTLEGAVELSGVEIHDIMDEQQQVLTSSSISGSSTVSISRTGVLN
jgi:hypothetical protein